MDEKQHRIFQKIENIVTILLSSIQQTKQLNERYSLHNNNNNNNEQNNKNHDSNIKTDLLEIAENQSILLRQLHDTIQNCYENDLNTKNDDNIDLVQKTITSMMDYILLPICCILQTNQEDCQSHDNIIYHSAIFKSMEEGSRLLSSIIERLRQNSNNRGCCHPLQSSNLQGEQQRYVLSSKIRIKCLISCTMAITFIDSLIKMNEQRLDKGENCLQQLFLCIQNLSQNPYSIICEQNISNDSNNTLHHHDEEFSKLFYETMDGNLLARIVESCISSFDPKLYRYYDSNNKQEENLDRDRQVHNIQSMRGNVPLKLQAMSTLETLINVSVQSMDTNGHPNSNIDSADVMIWRKLFPGCFSTIYRATLTSLKISTAQSSTKMSLCSLRLLSTLLKKCLKRGSHIRIVSNQTLLSDLLVASGVQSRECIQDDNHCTVVNDDPNDLKFFNNVRQRVPAPLILLIRLISSHQKMLIRKEGVCHLIRVILIDTLPIWVDWESNDIILESDNIVHHALECLLMSLCDDDEEIVNSSQKILYDHIHCIGSHEWRKIMSETIIPKILELIHSLPALARSGRDIELAAQLNLIRGYLILSKQKLLGGEKMINISFLVDQLMEQKTRSCLVDIFSLDNTMVPLSSQLVLSSDSQNSESFMSINDCNYVYLRGKTVVLAYKLIEAIGHTIGFKHSIVLIDDCIVSLYDDINEKISRQQLIFDKLHSSWISRRHGLITVATELIKSMSTSKEETFDDKVEKRRSKLMQALISSILPLLFSDQIWQLPTTFIWAKYAYSHGTGDVIGSDPFTRPRHQSSLSYTSTITRDPVQNLEKESKEMPEISISALNGNSMLLVTIMNFISALPRVALLKFEIFFPSCLYPLLQKMSDLNSRIVQQTAADTLTIISSAAGKESLTDVLSHNYDYILELIISQFTSPAQHTLQIQHQRKQQAICFHSLNTVFEILLKKTSLNEYENRLYHIDTIDKTSQKSSSFNISRINNLINLIDVMIKWFDRNFHKNVQDVLNQIAVPLGLIQVCITSVEFIEYNLWETEQLSNIVNVSYEVRTKQPWFDLLEEFEESNEYDYSSLKKSSKLLQTLGRDPNFSEDREKLNHESKNDDHNLETLEKYNESFLQKLIQVMKRILFISSFFLTIPELKIQRSSCEAIFNSMRLLGHIQNYAKTYDDDQIQISIGNPLLTSIHECWLPIVQRLDSCISSFIYTSSHNNEQNYMIPRLDQDRHENALNRTVFISHLMIKLFEVVSIQIEYSGDFMTDRFQHELWPKMAVLLNRYIQIRLKKKEPPSSIIDHTSKIENQVVVSCLKCIQVAFAQREMGERLHALIPLIETIVLAVLAVQDEEVGSVAMACMKSMLLIDCDSLWRGLVNCCGEIKHILQVPLPHPFYKHLKGVATNPHDLRYGTKNETHSLSETNGVNDTDALIAKRAKELILFIQSMAEQDISYL